MEKILLIGNLDSAELSIYVLILVVVLVLFILYLATLQNTIKLINPENRQLEPGQVWLIFIPIFGLIWQFMMVTKIAESLKLEFEMREIPIDEEKPGYGIGIAYCVLFCCNIIPTIGGFTSIAGFICLGIYWNKINGYKRMLEENSFM